MYNAEWIEEAKCKNMDPQFFYPTAYDAKTTLQANKTIENVEKERALFCIGCPVKKSCLEYAYATDLQGIAGGTTTAERKRNKRNRQKLSA